MVRVNHLYRSALKVAVAQMEILDEEFATLNDRSPIHHIEYRIKTLDSIVEKLQRRGHAVTIDNIYAYVQDVAGITLSATIWMTSIICAACSPGTGPFQVIQEVDYIKTPKPSGYRSLHLIVEVPIVISEGTLHLPGGIQLQHHRHGYVGQPGAPSCGINPPGAFSPGGRQPAAPVL